MYKQFIIYFVFLLVASSSLNAQFSGGSGTVADPYQIATKANLDSIRYFMTSNFIQTTDIVFTDADFAVGGAYYNDGTKWKPIGNYSNFPNSAFRGTYDGRGFTIDNIQIDRQQEDFVGLFGTLGSPAVIYNLRMTNVLIKGRNYVGGFCGSNTYGNISNLYVKGYVSGKNNVGGFCGSNYYGRIEACYFKDTVIGHEYVGGFCGENMNGKIYNSYTMDTVSGVYYVGGFCGANKESGIISKCYSNTSVKGTNNVGGFCGANDYLIDNCYSLGNVNADGTNCGGFCGANYSTIRYCYSIGKDLNAHNIGGFCGWSNGGINEKCFWDTEASGIATSSGGIGKTTAAMNTTTTFTDSLWDFVFIWRRNDSFNNKYPNFKWCYPESTIYVSSTYNNTTPG